jgi:hypothetical protein
MHTNFIGMGERVEKHNKNKRIRILPPQPSLLQPGTLLPKLHPHAVILRPVQQILLPHPLPALPVPNLLLPHPSQPQSIYVRFNILQKNQQNIHSYLEIKSSLSN